MTGSMQSNYSLDLVLVIPPATFLLTSHPIHSPIQSALVLAKKHLALVGYCLDHAIFGAHNQCLNDLLVCILCF